MNASGRALVLPGGGARVAWQAGAVLALEQAGLTFGHLDGTSGGITNTAALMSGVAPADLCDRWVTLPARRFVSPLPLRTYLSAPRLPALAGASGVRDEVFPHLGIDVAAIRAREVPTATFNVANFDEKVSVALDHTVVTIDHLIAGLSLPIAMPAVAHDGVTWTDAAWIRDSNLEECERRGASEIWVLWCIGNTPRFGENALEQYVNMIEMSAIGALNLEIARIAERNDRREHPVRVHLIKPQHPLPLDPWYLAGRIDGHTLVAMGYRDASAYLASHVTDSDTWDGIRLDPDATKMTDPPLGVRVSLVSRGSIDTTDATLRTTVELHDIAGPADAPRPAVGSLRFGDGVHWIADGECWWDDRRLHVAGTVDLPSGRHRIDAELSPRDTPGRTTVTLRGRSGETSATFTSSRRDLTRALASIEPSAARGALDRVRAVRALFVASG